MYYDGEEKITKVYGPYSTKKICQFQLKKWIDEFKNSFPNIEIKTKNSPFGGKGNQITLQLYNANSETYKIIAWLQMFEMKLPTE
jgi:hypothetical protein